MKYHKTKDGTKIKLSDLELSHLKNILRWIDRKAAEGDGRKNIAIIIPPYYFA